MSSRWRARRGERGLLTTELAVLFPIVLVAILVVVQIALWSHANAIAQAAAEHGAEVASTYGATPDEGEAAALEFVNAFGQVRDASATVADDGVQVTVTVRGSYASVVGLLTVEATTTLIAEEIPTASPFPSTVGLVL